MLYESLARAIGTFRLGNKIDKDGYVTTEQDETFKFATPPKKREAYESDAEFERAKQEYAKFQEDVRKYREGVKKMFKKTFEISDDKLFQKGEMKEAIKADNKVRIQNGFPEDVARTDIDLSSSEVARRKKIQAQAQETLEDKISIQVIGNMMINNYARSKGLGQPDRSAMDIFSAGVKTIDDLYKDYDILINGTQEEKNQMFKRKFQAMKEVMNFMCEQKTPEEYVAYFKENFLTISAMPEIQTDNLKHVMSAWGIQIDEKTYQDIVDNNSALVSIGSYQRQISVYANPYYTRIKESCYKAKDPMDAELLIDLDFVYMIDKEVDRGVASSVEDVKAGKPIATLINDYLADQSFGKKEKSYPVEMAYAYFKKSGGTITKFKDEEGNLVEGNPKALAKEAAKRINAGQTILIYDTLGNFKTKMLIPDADINDIPQTYSGGLKTVNFKYDNTVDQIKNLKEEFKECRGYFSHDHQEYKDIKTFINGMEESYKKGTSLATLCSKLRKLAVAYVESKYENDTPEKTERTYQREEFMCRLIKTIDDKYPIHYPVEVKKNTIKDLKNADLKNDKLLKDIIQMNEEGHSREEVETYAQEKIYEDRTQIEMNLDEAKNENDKNIFDNAEDVKEENQIGIEKVGMSEKDN